MTEGAKTREANWSVRTLNLVLPSLPPPHANQEKNLQSAKTVQIKDAVLQMPSTEVWIRCRGNVSLRRERRADDFSELEADRFLSLCLFVPDSRELGSEIPLGCKLQLTTSCSFHQEGYDSYEVSSPSRFFAKGRRSSSPPPFPFSFCLARSNRWPVIL